MIMNAKRFHYLGISGYYNALKWLLNRFGIIVLSFEAIIFLFIFAFGAARLIFYHSKVGVLIRVCLRGDFTL